MWCRFPLPHRTGLQFLDDKADPVCTTCAGQSESGLCTCKVGPRERDSTALARVGPMHAPEHEEQTPNTPRCDISLDGTTADVKMPSHWELRLAAAGHPTGSKDLHVPPAALAEVTRLSRFFIARNCFRCATGGESPTTLTPVPVLAGKSGCAACVLDSRAFQVLAIAAVSNRSHQTLAKEHPSFQRDPKILAAWVTGRFDFS